MSSQHSRLVARRGQLMAEVLLLDLGAKRIFRQGNEDSESEYVVIFEKEREDQNAFAVKLKATERPPGKRIQLERRELEGNLQSSFPPLLLVADVKRTQMYYAWLTAMITSTKEAKISVPLSVLDNLKKAELKMQFQAYSSMNAVAG